jgi:hypothetical protein
MIQLNSTNESNKLNSGLENPRTFLENPVTATKTCYLNNADIYPNSLLLRTHTYCKSTALSNTIAENASSTDLSE